MTFFLKIDWAHDVIVHFGIHYYYESCQILRLCCRRIMRIVVTIAIKFLAFECMTILRIVVGINQIHFIFL